MGNRNNKKKMKKKSSSLLNAKRRQKKINRRPASTYKPVMFYGELEDMRKLSSKDEAFHISWETLSHIIDIIGSRKTPTPNSYRHWNEYARSFYLKMCTCYGLHYQHLEDDFDENGNQLPVKDMLLLKEQEKHMEETYAKEKLSKQEENVECSDANQPNAKEMTIESWLDAEYGCSRVILDGPFEFGSYAYGTEPKCIPYHLNLLVMEAADIAKRLEEHNNNKDLMDLNTVENKILFFCTYFHSHLPNGWNYERHNASLLIVDYGTMGMHPMSGYTPIGDRVDAVGFDSESDLTPSCMADVMSIIHSRKTPFFWNMYWAEIQFYCRICSCFGIDYQCLEAASEDDVCLMNVGRKPPQFLMRA